MVRIIGRIDVYRIHYTSNGRLDGEGAEAIDFVLSAVGSLFRSSIEGIQAPKYGEESRRPR